MHIRVNVPASLRVVDYDWTEVQNSSHNNVLRQEVTIHLYCFIAIACSRATNSNQSRVKPNCVYNRIREHAIPSTPFHLFKTDMLL